MVALPPARYAEGVRSLLGPSVALACLAAAPAIAQPAALDSTVTQAASASSLDLTDSQSIGHADGGALLYPFAVESDERLAALRGPRYGTRELVGLLHRAADRVARAHPGSRLAVGDLSSESGGPLAPHGSHQSGRDVDVGFYVLDANGRQMPQGIFSDITADGSGRRGAVRFDDARNWELLVAFVDDPMAEVQHVLIASHLRERLLAYARAAEVPEDQLRRVELVTRHIRGSENHDDHFHVRIYCSVGDRPQCLDRPPLHPWYYGTPSPRAVEAARVADLQRAAAMRRMQEQARIAEAQLAHDRAVVLAADLERARALALEPGRQALAEQRRAAALSRDDRLAVIEARRREASLRVEDQRQAAAERGRSAELAASERRWRAQERRRAERLRAARARFEQDERRRAAALLREERRAQRMLERSAELQRRNARRAQELIRRGEQLRRQVGDAE